MRIVKRNFLRGVLNTNSETRIGKKIKVVNTRYLKKQEKEK